MSYQTERRERLGDAFSACVRVRDRDTSGAKTRTDTRVWKDEDREESREREREREREGETLFSKVPNALVPVSAVDVQVLWRHDPQFVHNLVQVLIFRFVLGRSENAVRQHHQS